MTTQIASRKTSGSTTRRPATRTASAGLEALERRALMSAAPAALTAPPRDHLILQAEQAVVSGAKISKAGTGYTGTGYVDFVNAKGDYVEFTINAPVAGSYSLEFRYANGGPSAAMGLSVNGVQQGSREFLSSNGSWNEWFGNVSGANLKAGVNKVRLYTNGQQGPNVDSLIVRRTNTVDGPGRYEAESSKVATVKGGVVANAHAGFHNTGYVDFLNAKGDSLQFTIKPFAGGSYALDFRYANGGTGARTMGLQIDGKDVPGGITFGSTGSWTSWKVATTTVTLTPGTHTVRLYATGQSGPNIDWLTTEGIAFPAASAKAATSDLLTAPQAPKLAASFSDVSVADVIGDNDAAGLELA